jgi:hypothetical protein
MLPPKDSPKQPRKSHKASARTTPPLVPRHATAPWPATEDGPLCDDPGPAAHTRAVACGPDELCPTCGRPYVFFSLRASGVLDALGLARDVISDAIALVEEETLP